MLNNYHTHTKRCRHAAGEDRDYVERALAEGFSTLGFSDHTPWPYVGFESPIRMAEGELEGYVSSLKGLREEFKDQIKIFIGLECESFPEYCSWLKERKEEYGLDYLILGNHYPGGEGKGLHAARSATKEDFSLYVKRIEEAFETGLFACLAHPDICFCHYLKFDELARSVSSDICNLALEYNIPLEYNTSGLNEDFEGLGYPGKDFWSLALEKGVSVIVGLDAHEPGKLDADLLARTQTELRQKGFKLIESLSFR
jgi:histidinol phosphate phosphatase HisJ family